MAPTVPVPPRVPPLSANELPPIGPLIASAPASVEVVPVYVFAAVSAIAPGPVLTTPPAPLSTAVAVSTPPELTLNVRFVGIDMGNEIVFAPPEESVIPPKPIAISFPLII